MATAAFRAAQPAWGSSAGHSTRWYERRLPKLTVDQILAWADAHFEPHGRLPVQSSGTIAGAPGEKWRNINSALLRGHRGLPGGRT